MNDASSHMNAPVPMGAVNPKIGYMDVNELADRFAQTKKRKNKEGVSKYHSRVPILNQTEYFSHRQKEAGVIDPGEDVKSAALHQQKPLPATSHRTDIDGRPEFDHHQDFLVFEQTSDNG